jgi:hypothetical protein
VKLYEGFSLARRDDFLGQTHDVILQIHLGLVLGHEQGHLPLGGIVGRQGLVELGSQLGFVGVGNQHLPRAVEESGASDEDGQGDQQHGEAGRGLRGSDLLGHGRPFLPA